MSADYTGASADTVQKSVIVPIEEAINGVDGIDYISSSSTSSGSAYISVVFKSGIDPDMAVVMVKNRVAEVEGILPQEVVKTGVHASAPWSMMPLWWLRPFRVSLSEASGSLIRQP